MSIYDQETAVRKAEALERIATALEQLVHGFGDKDPKTDPASEYGALRSLYQLIRATTSVAVSIDEQGPR